MLYGPNGLEPLAHGDALVARVGHAREAAGERAAGGLGVRRDDLGEEPVPPLLESYSQDGSPPLLYPRPVSPIIVSSEIGEDCAARRC